LAAVSTTSAAANATEDAAGNRAVLDQEAAQRGFSRSILISATRCTLTYIVLPFVAPLIHLAPTVGPVIGLVVGTVAITANLFSIRRFWRANHRYKVPATVLHCSVITLLIVLMTRDVIDLLS
jgi:hypothetical protein